MIHLTHSVSGDEIGRLLLDDPEEAGRAIIAMSDVPSYARDAFFEGMAERIGGNEQAIKFIVDLAAALGAERK